MGRPLGSTTAIPNVCTKCGEDDPHRFGAIKTKCLKCRRDYAGKWSDDKVRAKRFEKAMETLKLINSFPTKEALCR